MSTTASNAAPTRRRKLSAALAMPDEKSAADIFSETGRAIYDDAEDWPSRLAAGLDITRETVRNIRRGNMVVNPEHGILTDLMALAERRAAETAKARDILKAWLAEHRRPEAGT